LLNVKQSFCVACELLTIDARHVCPNSRFLPTTGYVHGMQKKQIPLPRSPVCEMQLSRTARKRLKKPPKQDKDDGVFWKMTKIPHLVALIILSYVDNAAGADTVDALHFLCGPRLGAFQDAEVYVSTKLWPRVEKCIEQSYYCNGRLACYALLEAFKPKELYLLYRWFRKPMLEKLSMSEADKLQFELELCRAPSNKIGFDIFMTRIHATGGRMTWEAAKQAQRREQSEIDDQERFRKVKVQVVNTSRVVCAPQSEFEFKLDADRRAQDEYFSRTTKEERHAHELEKQRKLLEERKKEQENAWRNVPRNNAKSAKPGKSGKRSKS
jgi:hypothetical protein